MEGTYVHGQQLTIDYTPGADVAAGQVVVQEELVGIALMPIASGELGSLCVEGVFDIVKTAAAEAMDVGELVYWDEADTSATLLPDTATNKLIGKCVKAATAAATSVRVKLDQ